MSGCPTVHEHPEFKKSYDPSDSDQVKLINKIKRFLASPSYLSFGEYLKHALAGFKSHPHGRTNRKCVFILCRDCKAEILKKRCSFCRQEGHTMNDAVLFYSISEHDADYGKANKLATLYKQA